MNIKPTKEFFDANDVVVLRADVSTNSDAIDTEMSKLGNPLGLIPFYAIYAPGQDNPRTFSGPISSGSIITAIEEIQGVSARNGVHQMR